VNLGRREKGVHRSWKKSGKGAGRWANRVGPLKRVSTWVEGDIAEKTKQNSGEGGTSNRISTGQRKGEGKIGKRAKRQHLRTKPQ